MIILDTVVNNGSVEISSDVTSNDQRNEESFIDPQQPLHQQQQVQSSLPQHLPKINHQQRQQSSSHPHHTHLHHLDQVIPIQHRPIHPPFLLEQFVTFNWNNLN